MNKKLNKTKPQTNPELVQQKAIPEVSSGLALIQTALAVIDSQIKHVPLISINYMMGNSGQHLQFALKSI